MDVRAFPRYNNLESASGYTLFKPGDNLPDSLRGIASPQTVNVGFDSLLRKVLPGLPMDPHYIREHGLRDAADNLTSGIGGELRVDLGNIERGRPLVYNTALTGMEDPNRMDQQSMFEQMLKHSSIGKSFTPEALKSKVMKLIGSKSNESVQKTDKISMRSENFLKTIDENKKNVKVAALPGALLRGGLNTAMGYGAAKDINTARESAGEGNIGGMLHGASSAASGLAIIRGLGSNKAMGRLGALGAPGAILNTGEELGALGESWNDGSVGGVLGHGAMAGLNGGTAASNIAQGMNTYKSIAGAVGRNTPGVLNSARNIATGAGNALRTGMGTVLPQAARAGSVIAPSLGNAATAVSSAAPGAVGAARGLAGKAFAPLALANMAKQTYDIAQDPASIGKYQDEMESKGVFGRALSGLSNSPLAIASAGKGLYDLGKTTVQNAMGPSDAAMDKQIADLQSRKATMQANGTIPNTPQPGQPVQANSNPVKPIQGNNTGSTTAASPMLNDFAPGTDPESVAANKEIADNRNKMLNDPQYKADLARQERMGIDTSYAKDRYEANQMMHQINPTGAPGEHSGTFEQGKLVTPPNNNAQAPLPEQKSAIPPMGSPNTAPVSGSGSQPVGGGSDDVIKMSQDAIVEPSSIPTVKPMEHIPRPPESPDLVQNPQFASDSVKNENIEHNRAILENRTIQRKASGLPPNPFLGRVTGVEQTTGGVTTQYKPSSNAIVTDQQEALQRAVPAHQSVTDGIDLLSGNDANGSGYQTKNTGGGSSQLIGPDGKVHGTMQVNPSKAVPNLGLGKSSELKRRNTGIGDWVNPEDFQYLEKSALWKGITPEEYSNLPLSPNQEGIIQFFLPHS